MDFLSRSRIEAMLTTHLFGRNLVVLPSTGSTNDVAKGLAEQGAPEGTVVVADEQTAGRGRMGRRWQAPPGTSLLLSILFRPGSALTRIPHLTMLCSLAVADAVGEMTAVPVWLKWPNDLILLSGAPVPHWHKLGGILTETGVVGERVEFVVVGIGINVNVQPEVLPTLAPDAASILAETGRRVDREMLLAAVLARVETRYSRLREGESPYAEWVSRLATLGRSVAVTTPTGLLAGVAEAVDQEGALLLRSPDGRLHRLLAGDVVLAH